MHRTIYRVEVGLEHHVAYRGLRTSCCISFDVSGEGEHNDIILEVLALFIDKLLARTYIDLT